VLGDRVDSTSQGFSNLITTPDYVPPSPALPQPEEQEESDDEDPEDYRPGGYHPVEIGERFNNGRYQVIKKLGWGHFSTVWLCYDKTAQKHVAVKVQKSAENYADAARDEIRLLDSLKGSDPTGTEHSVVELLDHFEHEGPHGTHICLVFEVLGKSLLSLIRRCNYRGAPISLVKVIAREVLEGLMFLHESCNIIHTDIKPENVLFVPPREEFERLNTEAREVAILLGEEPVNEARVTEAINRLRINQDDIDPDLAFSSEKLKVVDLGNACWVNEHFTEEIQTRQYRSPEVIIGAGYDTSADVWSSACMFFEVATGDYLFDPQSGRNYTRDEDHLALMSELMGPVPLHLILRGSLFQNFFTRTGELRHIAKLNFWGLRDVLREKYQFRPDDADQFASFLLPMLVFDPARRASCRSALNHPFLRTESAAMAAEAGLERQSSSFQDMGGAGETLE